MKITVNIPGQYLLTEDPTEFGRKVALYAALLMFRSGELSAGAAAEFAGVDRMSFAVECRRHGIPVVGYGPDELEAEVESLRQAS